MKSALKRERTILNISFLCSVLFILVEVICTIYTKSNALFMDCIYDMADLIMIGPFILLIPLLYLDETEKHPYGYAQVESLFIMIKSAILLVVTALLVINSVKVIIDGGNDIDAAFLANFQFVVSIICCAIYFVLKKMGKGITSPSLDAELYIWKLDSMSTMGVCVAFVIGMFIEKTSFAPFVVYIDPLIAIILACFLIKEPLGLFIRSIKSLILFAPDKETFNKVKNICTKYITKYGYLVNFIDVNKTGRKIWVEVYFTNNDDLVSINKIKTIRRSIEEELKEHFDSVFIYVIPELDEISDENKKKLRETNRRPDTITYLTEIKKKKEHK